MIAFEDDFSKDKKNDLGIEEGMEYAQDEVDCQKQFLRVSVFNGQDILDFQTRNKDIGDI